MIKNKNILLLCVLFAANVVAMKRKAHEAFQDDAKQALTEIPKQRAKVGISRIMALNRLQKAIAKLPQWNFPEWKNNAGKQYNEIVQATNETLKALENKYKWQAEIKLYFDKIVKLQNKINQLPELPELDGYTQQGVQNYINEKMKLKALIKSAGSRL